MGPGEVQALCNFCRRRSAAPLILGSGYIAHICTSKFSSVRLSCLALLRRFPLEFHTVTHQLPLRAKGSVLLLSFLSVPNRSVSSECIIYPLSEHFVHSDGSMNQPGFCMSSISRKNRPSCRPPYVTVCSESSALEENAEERPPQAITMKQLFSTVGRSGHYYMKSSFTESSLM